MSGTDRLSWSPMGCLGGAPKVKPCEKGVGVLKPEPELLSWRVEGKDATFGGAANGLPPIAGDWCGDADEADIWEKRCSIDVLR